MDYYFISDGCPRNSKNGFCSAPDPASAPVSTPILIYRLEELRFKSFLVFVCIPVVRIK